MHLDLGKTLGVLDVVSVAGLRTRVALPGLSLSFDMGHCDDVALATQHVFLSHTHMDHMNGVWQHATIQHFAARRVGTYGVPHMFVGALHDHFRSCEALDCGGEVARNVVPVGDGARFRLRPDLYVVPFPTSHRVPSYGYALVSTKRKLKEEFRTASGVELSELRGRGVEIDDVVETVEFAYSGDTRIEGVAGELARAAKTLVLECTYVGGDVPVDKARAHGHVHLDEIGGNATLFGKTERLVLMHFSKRHKAHEIVAQAQRALPAHLYDRTTLVLDSHT